MAGDANIARMRDMMQREAAGKNQAQAGGWRDLQAVFTAFSDALQRHATALEDGWPRTNPAAAAFLAHVDNLLEPLQGQAVIASSDNATAVVDIESSAKTALSSMDSVYTRSAAINQQWDKVASQSQPSDSAEITYMKQQGAVYGSANTVIEGYKTDVAQTVMTQPPTYLTPLPSNPEWLGGTPTQSSAPSGGGSTQTIPSGSGSAIRNSSAATTSGDGGPGLAGGPAQTVTLPPPASAAPPAPTPPTPSGGNPFPQPVLAPPPPASSAPWGTPESSIPSGLPSSSGGGGWSPSTGESIVRPAPSVIGSVPEELRTGIGGRTFAPGAAPSIVGGRPAGMIEKPPASPTSGVRESLVGNSASGAGGRSNGQVSARVRGLGTGTKGVRGVLDDPSPTRSSLPRGQSRRRPLSDGRGGDFGGEYETDDLWTVPLGAPTVVAPVEDAYDADPGPAIGR